MKNNLGVCILMLLLIGSVGAEAGAKCQGNTLVYYDLSNKVISRDCSILHAGNAQAFRGICREYDGGADCWRTNGSVTSQYRDIVRNYTYNASSDPWGAPYVFEGPTASTISSSAQIVVTTTTIAPCPKVVCDYSKYESRVYVLNLTSEQCDVNLKALTALNAGMYSAESYQNMVSQKDSDLKVIRNGLVACQSANVDLSGKNGLYSMVAVVSVIILIFVVVVWVRYEWIGDPKLKTEFGSVSKRKN